jgi:hypothetical protein
MSNFDDKHDEDAKQVQGLLASAKSIKVKSPHFLSTRVMAQIDELSENKAKKTWSLANIMTALSVSFSVALLVFFLNTNQQQNKLVSIQIGPAYVIKVDIKKMKNKGVKFVNIQLPKGLSFYASDDSQLSEQMEMLIEWDFLKNRHYLPIVVVGNKVGKKKIVINFKDDQEGKLEQLDYTVQIVKGSS